MITVHTVAGIRIWQQINFISKVIELINPEVVETSGSQTGTEGCLSFPDEFGTVTRPRVVTVRAQDRNGKSFTVTGEGLKARAFCHEIDHLNGILFKDKMIRRVRPEER